MNIDGVMTIPTQMGVFRIVPSADTNYPGVSVYLNGELVSKTEYSSDTERVRTIAYSSNYDEPVAITNYNKRGE